MGQDVLQLFKEEWERAVAVVALVVALLLIAWSLCGTATETERERSSDDEVRLTRRWSPALLAKASLPPAEVPPVERNPFVSADLPVDVPAPAKPPKTANKKKELVIPPLPEPDESPILPVTQTAEAESQPAPAAPVQKMEFGTLTYSYRATDAGGQPVGVCLFQLQSDSKPVGQVVKLGAVVYGVRVVNLTPESIHVVDAAGKPQTIGLGERKQLRMRR